MTSKDWSDRGFNGALGLLSEIIAFRLAAYNPLPVHNDGQGGIPLLDLQKHGKPCVQ